MKEGWEVKRLEDLLTLNQIGLVRNKKEQDPEFEFRYFKMDNIRNDNGIKEEGFSFINASAEEVSKYSLRNGDLLFNTRNSFELVGKSCLYTSDYQSPTIFNNNIMRMRFIPDLTSSYAAYAFSSELVLDQLEKIKSGTTSVVGIYFKTLKNIQIPVPPLAEQEAIVEVLDKAFAAIDQAKANIEQNIANAKELFQSKLNQIFSQKGEGWVEGKLGEYCDLSRGHNPPKSKFISEPKEGYVRFWQIRDGWSEAHKVYVPQSPQLHTVEPEDFLMVAYRHIGKVFRGAKGAFNVALCKIKNVRQDLLLDDYLFHMIPSDVIRGELLKRSERSLIPSMSIKHLEIIEIPVPPLDEQRLLIQQLDSLTSETKEIESIYQTKLASLDELKKSILQKAFAGELT